MAENFRPNGTSVASSTVGIIDAPNFTVYVGITRNGFATIKCGAGRYTFVNSLEF